MATIDDNTQLIPNTEKAVEFLLKYGNQKFCLSAIDPDGAIETVTFGRGQEKEMGSWIDKYQTKRNLYYHINSVKGWPNNKKEIVGLLNEWPETGDNPEGVAIEPWRLHDLRRTAASGMARLGIPVHVIEAVLNHRSGQVSGVAAIYNRHRYLPEKRRALKVWAEHIIGLQFNVRAERVSQ